MKNLIVFTAIAALGAAFAIACGGSDKPAQDPSSGASTETPSSATTSTTETTTTTTTDAGH